MPTADKVGERGEPDRAPRFCIFKEDGRRELLTANTARVLSEGLKMK